MSRAGLIQGGLASVLALLACGPMEPTPAPPTQVCERGAPGTLCTLVGTGDMGFNGDGLPAHQTWLFSPTSARQAPDGQLYVMDFNNLRLRRVTPSGAVETVAGDGTHAWAAPGADALSSPLENPFDFAFGPGGMLLLSELHTGRVLRITQAGTLEVVAGRGEWGYDGDGGPATEGAMTEVTGLTLAADGTLYVSDTFNGAVRAVAPDGTLSTVAGSGTLGYGGDGATATQALLNQPQHLALGEGALYIADAGNHAIRRVRLPEGRIETVVGTGVAGAGEDGDQASGFGLNTPYGVAVGPHGRLYIADSGNHVVRRVEADGSMSTVAGTGVKGHAADGDVATQAPLAWPVHLSFSPEGDLYITQLMSAKVTVLWGPVP